MKKILSLLVLLIISFGLFAQEENDFTQTPVNFNEDSLQKALERYPRDTTRVNLLIMLARNYFFKQPETSLQYAIEILNLSRELNYPSGIANGLFRTAEANRSLGNYIESIKQFLQLLEFGERYDNPFWKSAAFGGIGNCYFELQDYQQAIDYLRKSINLFPLLKPGNLEILFKIYLARAFNEMGNTDSAYYYLHHAESRIAIRMPQQRALKFIAMGDYFLNGGSPDSAAHYYRQAFSVVRNSDAAVGHRSMVTVKLSALAFSQNEVDSGLYYANYAHQLAARYKLNNRLLEASRLLSQGYRKVGKLDSALQYMDMAGRLNDSIYGQKKFSELNLLVLKEQQRNQSLLQEKERRQNQNMLLSLIIISIIILMAGIALYMGNRAKRLSLIQLESTLNKLKSTQNQLIQSEKMASLGELTAGIAHEIQNPLNFVNNFSEVSSELLDEIKSALATSNQHSDNYRKVIEIADELKKNLEKITHHGKRADAIVKSMLQHSRGNGDKKELTDINGLADEFVKLAYHGMRGKDKSFNAELKTDFDPSLPKINVIPQDIGRVLVNLLNNAFHAVAEARRAKEIVVPDKQGSGLKAESSAYKPSVSVSTKKLDGNIEIRVSDNGPGIPDSIREKIFQPFFTTKPAGEGTGLGLSLSYDIITKGHNGSLDIDTTGHQGTVFIIRLPI